MDDDDNDDDDRVSVMAIMIMMVLIMITVKGMLINGMTLLCLRVLSASLIIHPISVPADSMQGHRGARAITSMH